MRERTILKKAGVFSVIAVLLLTATGMTVSARNDTTQSVTTCAPIGDPTNVTFNFKGGFGFTIVITNTGNATMAIKNWTYNINMTLGLILLGKTKSGTNITLAPGASTKIKTIPIGIGVGTVEINMSVPDEYVYEYWERVYFIGPFVLPPQS